MEAAPAQDSDQLINANKDNTKEVFTWDLVKCWVLKTSNWN